MSCSLSLFFKTQLTIYSIFIYLAYFNIIHQEPKSSIAFTNLKPDLFEVSFIHLRQYQNSPLNFNLQVISPCLYQSNSDTDYLHNSHKYTNMLARSTILGAVAIFCALGQSHCCISCRLLYSRFERPVSCRSMFRRPVPSIVAVTIPQKQLERAVTIGSVRMANRPSVSISTCGARSCMASRLMLVAVEAFTTGVVSTEKLLFNNCGYY